MLKKNHELFWILEILLLTPLAFLLMGFVLAMQSKSNGLVTYLLGAPIDPVKGFLIAVVCPAGAAWVAREYLKANKKEKSFASSSARAIVGIGIVTVILVVFYLFSENRVR